MKWIVLTGAAFVLAAAAAVGGLLAARDSSSSSAASGPPGIYRGSEPPAGIRAPDFTLRDYRGRTVRMASLRGRIVLTTFVDSACRESCPIIVAVIGAGLRQLSRAERPDVVALAITVSPKVDTPAHVRSFLARRRALAEVDYLVGTVEQLRPVWKAYGILPAVDTGDADVHSADVRIFDRDGEWVSTLHVGVDLTLANLTHDIRQALSR